MADNISTQILKSGELPFEPSDDAAPDFYSNMVYVSISTNDATLVFCRQLETATGTKIKTVARVVMSHSTFMIAGGVIGENAAILQKMYEGRYPALDAVAQDHPERFQPDKDSDE